MTFMIDSSIEYVMYILKFLAEYAHMVVLIWLIEGSIYEWTRYMNSVGIKKQYDYKSLLLFEYQNGIYCFCRNVTKNSDTKPDLILARFEYHPGSRIIQQRIINIPGLLSVLYLLEDGTLGLCFPAGKLDLHTGTKLADITQYFTIEIDRKGVEVTDIGDEVGALSSIVVKSGRKNYRVCSKLDHFVTDDNYSTDAHIPHHKLTEGTDIFSLIVIPALYDDLELLVPWLDGWLCLTSGGALKMITDIAPDSEPRIEANGETYFPANFTICSKQTKHTMRFARDSILLDHKKGVYVADAEGHWYNASFSPPNDLNFRKLEEPNLRSRFSRTPHRQEILPWQRTILRCDSIHPKYRFKSVASLGNVSILIDPESRIWSYSSSFPNQTYSDPKREFINGRYLINLSDSLPNILPINTRTKSSNKSS